ncbi:WGR domain-containing protein [Agrobacterium rhizogenes]|uniref:WGR domain-containing protein n=1 Tax=Rhizobium rhizogenes TaxID=359 RepID=UPI00081011B6|nr:WGR domain-containing protein [Rhizobium rhizogenes]OCJ22144.1 WGR domain-containing protein [Agrobacterium sp. B131/95]OCJ27321.1 WGR domain-containing protein [Agrobacterium sp. B133/95]NTI46107.1 WGR domain-containing protein [Rhizobium rhizogenes]NTI52791.1 WGR domain-containing protein [Rhizobium rhizogenes]NTI98164.1 WGR domain-containing protein [Rhizobium rhizogenes]
MCPQPYRLHIQRIDPSRNMARFYEISLEPTLFGETSLVRIWGRLGTRGQQRIDVFPSEKPAVEAFLELLRQKRAKGYRPGRVINGVEIPLL